MKLPPININGENITVGFGVVGNTTDGLIYSTLFLHNNQSDSVVKTVMVGAAKYQNEKLETAIIAIQIPNTDIVKSRAKERGINILSEERDVSRIVGNIFNGKMFSEGLNIGVFYGQISGDESAKKDYQDIKTKLMDTDFLGSDKNKRENFVLALEEGIKNVMGYTTAHELPQGPERFISDKTGKGIGE